MIRSQYAIDIHILEITAGLTINCTLAWRLMFSNNILCLLILDTTNAFETVNYVKLYIFNGKKHKSTNSMKFVLYVHCMIVNI